MGVDWVADYALSLLPQDYTFPRDGMFGLKGYVTVGDEIRHGRLPLLSKEDLIRCLESSRLHNCFLCTHSPLEQQLGVISVIFIDIDLEGDLQLARKYALKASRRVERELGVRPLVQLSGGKGCHVITPSKPKPVPGGPLEAKEYLKWLQERLSYGFCDRQILGDVNRLFRIPWTLNSKISDDGGLVSRTVEVVQEWDGERADLSLLYGDFKIWKASAMVENRKKPKAYVRRPRGYEWIEALLKTPIPDGRKTCIGLAIAPYLVKVKGLEPSEARMVIDGWLDGCDRLRKVDVTARVQAAYQPRYVKRRLEQGANVPIISFRKLCERLRQMGVGLKGLGEESA